MNILILGLGSIAKKHIKILFEIDPKMKIYALRSSKNNNDISNVYNLYIWEDVLKIKFDFSIISSPSYLHLDHLKLLMQIDIPIFIEKPLFINKNQIKSFYNLKKKNIKSYVACNFRFNPIIKFLKESYLKESSKILEVSAYCGSYLPDWRSNIDYRKNYSSKKKLGGGVNLDLIHEPDYFIYLFGLPKAVKVFNRKVSSLEIDSFDSSIINFNYENFQGTITLNYFRKTPKRSLEIVLENDIILIDFLKGTIKSLDKKSFIYKNNNDLLKISYKDQMNFFLNCVKKNDFKFNTIEEATKVLNLIL